MRAVMRFLPGLARLRSYRLPWLRSDGLAGLTVASYLIPQCLAYGELAGVPPVHGLWAILPAFLLYALVGSSPQISVGPETTTALMTAAVVAPLAAGNGGAYAGLASLLALLVGLVCLVGALLRLGFLADLLSKPILVGYLAGVAVIMIVGQLDTITGIPSHRSSLLGTLRALVEQAGSLHPPTLALALGALALMLLLQWFQPGLPGPLLAVLAATAAVPLLHLERQGVALIGPIPGGLPHLTLPAGLPPDRLIPLLAASLGIALVGYSDNVLTARSFAARHGYRIDADQELLALGVVNLGTGLWQGFPVSSSSTRTAVGDATGSRTQLHSLVAFVVVVGVLLFLRPVLSLFPRPVLGAIVIFAALHLIDVGEFQRLRRFKSSEFNLALLTLAGVLLTDILVGVALAVGFSVIELFARLVRPNDGVLGSVPGLAGFHDVRDWQGTSTLPGLVLYRYDAPLCFANAEDFRRRALAAIAAETSAVKWFVLNAEAIVEIDITAADMLGELHHELKRRGIVFGMARVKQELFRELKAAGLVEQIGVDRFYPTLPTAVGAFEDREPTPGREWLPDRGE